MVIPVGLPDAQRLVVADKDMNGRVRTKEIMQVLFSLLEGSDSRFSTRLEPMVADVSDDKVQGHPSDLRSCHGLTHAR
jgi:hypothetical protein